MKSGLCAGHSSSSTPDFMEIALCAGAQSYWKRKGTASDCYHKVGSMELLKMSWYAETFRIIFSGTMGPSQAPEKQPHTLTIVPRKRFGRGWIKTSIVLLTTAKCRLIHEIVRWRSAIRHSREQASIALESSGGVFYITASDALHCTW